MKIIDAHLHFFPDAEHFRQTARAAGHEATLKHLRQALKDNGVVLGIGMGTTPVEEDCQNPLELPFTTDNWQEPFVQCLGIRAETITKENSKRVLSLFEASLQRPEVVGFKVYAGYQPFYVNDPLYWPFYEMAETYDVPVVIHTGDTANTAGRLKFSHPLTVDEAAVNFPRVNFVMAHYGNPWIVDATEVLAKNPNVYADLSGLAEGNFTAQSFIETNRAYLDMVKMWLTYLSRYDKLMYGSDWPLVNIGTYIELIKYLIPEEHHEAVFYQNAQRIFKKIHLPQ